MRCIAPTAHSDERQQRQELQKTGNLLNGWPLHIIAHHCLRQCPCRSNTLRLLLISVQKEERLVVFSGRIMQVTSLSWRGCRCLLTSPRHNAAQQRLSWAPGGTICASSCAKREMINRFWPYVIWTDWNYTRVKDYEQSQLPCLRSRFCLIYGWIWGGSSGSWF